MAGQHIISFPRSDELGSLVLAQVTTTGPDTRPLNLKIVATESESIFTVTLKHDRIQKFKERDNVSSEEWERILTSVLLEGEKVPDVEAVAAVSTDPESLTITIRKRVQGITSRLGAIVLAATEDEGLELFDMCNEALAARATAKADLAAATAKARELETQLEALKTQLDDLTKARGKDETQLLGDASGLINDKKVRVRIQHEVVTAARADAARSNTPSVEVKVEPASQPAPRGRGRGRGRVARAAPKTASRRGAKRKAASPPPPDESADDASEQMDVDQEEEADATADLSNDEKTTEDEATASEPEDDEPAEASTRGSRQKSTSLPVHKGPPPKRNLPFAVSKEKSPAPARKAEAAVLGSDTEDDEL